MSDPKSTATIMCAPQELLDAAQAYMAEQRNTERYIQDRRIRTLLRKLIDAGEAMRAAIECDSGPLKISPEEKARRARKWEAELSLFREEK